MPELLIFCLISSVIQTKDSLSLFGFVIKKLSLGAFSFAKYPKGFAVFGLDVVYVFNLG